MAIGGMIGGGIFSVLGVTVDLAGHLAFVAFLIGGAIAGLTARAYARLALHSGRSGGPFTYLRDEGHEAAAAWVAWLLIAGYVFALSVYAFTFGHYLANALGAPVAVARLGSVAVLGAFVAINLRGVATSGLTEDLVVLVKLVVLAGIALVGIGMFSPDRLAPLNDKGLLGVFFGASVIFVAYEGFELLPYDYDDIERPRQTLPRALYISVGVVALVYVAVTLASQMLVPDGLIASRKEVAFALVGQKAMGRWALGSDDRGALLDRVGDQRDAVLGRAPGPWRQRRRRAAGVLGAGTGRPPNWRDRLPGTARRRLLPAAGNRRGRLLRVADVPARLRPGQPHARASYGSTGLGPESRLPRSRQLFRRCGRASLLPGAIRSPRSRADRPVRDGGSDRPLHIRQVAPCLAPTPVPG